MSDGRAAHLTCPGCGGALYQIGCADRCQTCHGVWFDWFDGEASGLSLEIPPILASPISSRKMSSCPRDSDRLADEPYLGAGPVVARCPTCLGLFVRGHDLERLQQFHSRIPEISEEPLHRSSLLERIWYAFSG